MASSNPGPAITTQTPQQNSSGNIISEWVVQITPGLTTSIPANSSTEVVFTVPGVLLGDFANVAKTTFVAGLSTANVRVITAGQINVQIANGTASPISLLAGDVYNLNIARPSAQTVANGLPLSILTT